MNRKIISALIVTALVISGLALVIPGQIDASAALEKDFAPVDAGTDAKILNEDEVAEGDGSILSGESDVPASVQKTYLALDTAVGALRPTLFSLRGENDLCEVWVAVNTEFPADDPLGRNADPSRREITDAQVAMVLDEFANNIYVVEKDYFGEPPSLTGTDSVTIGGSTFDGFPTDNGQKTMIMIFNIRDNSYYDPIAYGTYVVGFFSSGIDDIYERNIIHLDCWRWAQRTGPQENPNYAYLYEATIAHEYQHLLHNAMDGNEVSWLNEGCSMYSEMLCGYGTPYSYLDEFMMYPDNSLTVWGDQGPNAILADYGAAAMFMIYLNDHYGGSETISALAHSKLTDIKSVTYVLRSLGYKTQFSDVFNNFRLANLLRSESPSSLYGYTSLDYAELGDLWLYAYEPSWGMVDRSDVTYVMGYGIDAYGTDYFVIGGSEWQSLKKTQYVFAFDGQDSKFSGWQPTNVDGTDYMWSGMGDMKDYWMVSEAMNLGAGEHSFSFDSWWNIEDNWDYGIVQYSTDGTNWATLENEFTSSDYMTDVPEIIDAVPGVTGYSGGDVSVSYDFNLDAASTVWIRMRYMTDQASNGSPEAPYGSIVGWLATGFQMDGADVSMPTTNSVSEDIDYMVTFYGQKGVNFQLVKIRDMKLDDKKEMGSLPLSIFSGYEAICVVISPTNGPCDYSFGIVKK